MPMSRFITLSLVALLALSISCAKTEVKKTELGLKATLPESFAGAEMTQSSEVRLFVGEDLYEHINGGAEVYHLYDFQEVATAYYTKDDIEIQADVFVFADRVGAFGLFSTVRPPEPEFLELGVESFQTPGSIDMVKGRYVVRLTGFDDSETTSELLRKMAADLVLGLDGPTELPELFGVFPGQNVVPHSEKIIAEAYLGEASLSGVYFRLYSTGDDTLTLFATPDSAGEKYGLWVESLRQRSTALEQAADTAYDNGAVIEFEHSFYGPIVAGLKSGLLIGAVGVTEEQRQFLSDWIVGVTY